MSTPNNTKDDHIHDSMKMVAQARKVIMDEIEGL